LSCRCNTECCLILPLCSTPAMRPPPCRSLLYLADSLPPQRFAAQHTICHRSSPLDLILWRHRCSPFIPEPQPLPVFANRNSAVPCLLNIHVGGISPFRPAVAARTLPSRLPSRLVRFP
jgi:hypothetical protein